MSTVLVTGGAGYVGSHACKALAAAGHVPVVFDDLSRGHRDLVKWGPLEVGDITNVDQVSSVIATYQPEAILHFAGLAYVDESIAHPEKYFHINTEGLRVMLEAMDIQGVRRIVFSSSCTVYGVGAAMAIPEDAACNPTHPYGECKRQAEKLLQAYHADHGISSVALRYGNACGADSNGETGADHVPEKRVIPRALMAAAGLIPVFDIFGNDYSTPDGTAIRDYVHVTDLASAHLAALNHTAEAAGASVFNLGRGRGHSVFEIVACVEEATGRKVPTRESLRRPGDVGELLLDPSLAKSVLGFDPRLSDLRTIVETAWAWHQTRWEAKGRHQQPEADVETS